MGEIDWLGWLGGLVGAGSSLFNSYQQQQSAAYEADLQQQIFKREDNAVQRRAADLEAAGLSKTLAAGGGANAGSAIKVTTPQSDAGDVLQNALNVSNIRTQILRQKKEIAQTEAQTKLIEEQKAAQEIANEYAIQNNPQRIEQAKLDIARRMIENRIGDKNVSIAQINLWAKDLAYQMDKYNYDWYKEYNLPTNAGLSGASGDLLKGGNIISSVIGDIVPKAVDIWNNRGVVLTKDKPKKNKTNKR